MHNNLMRNEYYVSDMVVESAEGVDLGQFCAVKNLSHGIQKRVINVKSVQLSKQIGKERGLYITFDCKKNVIEGKTSSAYLAGCISESIREIVGIVKKTAPVLVVGLGNRNIVCDSLGDKVAASVNVTGGVNASLNKKQCVCAISPGVLGTTGIQSAQIVSAICERIKPCAVILVDSLATGAVKRLGCSFQISSNGISPGSGVGQDKERIDKSVSGVPTISVGVPLMLSLRTCIYNFLTDYLRSQNAEINEFALRQKMADEMTRFVVSPQDVDYSVGLCAYVIAKAINDAFGV